MLRVERRPEAINPLHQVVERRAGAGGVEGSFYVNHAVSESQVPGIAVVTSGRYEDSIVNDLMPAIEITVLEGRVR